MSATRRTFLILLLAGLGIAGYEAATLGRPGTSKTKSQSTSQSTTNTGVAGPGPVLVLHQFKALSLDEFNNPIPGDSMTFAYGTDGQNWTDAGIGITDNNGFALSDPVLLTQGAVFYVTAHNSEGAKAVAGPAAFNGTQWEPSLTSVETLGTV